MNFNTAVDIGLVRQVTLIVQLYVDGCEFWIVI